MAYTRTRKIGYGHPLIGAYPGFSDGLNGTGSLETWLNNWDAFTGGHTESVGYSLPNQLGAANLAPLSGCTRFILFTCPIVPASNGSLQRLLNGEYDALVDALATQVVAMGLDPEEHGVRWGHEYNSGAGDSLTQGFIWATAHADPYTGAANGLPKFKAAAEYVENRWRAKGFVGKAVWCGGNHNTSAAPIATAIPDHGDPKTTCWDWDIYPGPPYNGNKNTINLSSLDTIYNGYVAYCRANGLIMGHSELGQILSPASSQRYNDNGLIMPWMYSKFLGAADVVGWLNFYWQNQHINNVSSNPLDELHKIAFDVSIAGGSPSGSPSTTPWTGPYPPGTSGPNVNGTVNTQALIGSLDNSSTAGLHFVWSNDPASIQKRDSWQATFGGVGSLNGKGAEGLFAPVVAPVIPTGPAGLLNVKRKRTRRQYSVYR